MGLVIVVNYCFKPFVDNVRFHCVSARPPSPRGGGGVVWRVRAPPLREGAAAPTPPPQRPPPPPAPPRPKAKKVVVDLPSLSAATVSARHEPWTPPGRLGADEELPPAIVGDAAARRDRHRVVVREAGAERAAEAMRVCDALRGVCPRPEARGGGTCPPRTVYEGQLDAAVAENVRLRASAQQRAELAEGALAVLRVLHEEVAARRAWRKGEVTLGDFSSWQPGHPVDPGDLGHLGHGCHRRHPRDSIYLILGV